MLTQLSDHTEDDAAFQWRSETKIAGAPHHKFAVPYSLEDRVFQEKKLQEALANVLISRGINRGRATGPTTGPTPAPGTTPPAPPMPSTGLAAPSFEARVPGGTYVDPEAAERARKIKDFLEYLRNLNANRGNSTDPTPESPVVDFPLPPAPSTSTAEPTVFAITSVGAPEADPAAEKKAKRGEYWDKVKMVASETFVIGLELVAGKYSNRPAVALSSTSVPDILNTLVKHKYFDERARQQGYTTTEAIQGMPAEKRDSLWSTLMNDSEIKKDAGKIFLDLVKMAVVSRKSEKFLSGAVQKTAADILKLREDCLEVLAEEKAAKARGTRS